MKTIKHSVFWFGMIIFACAWMACAGDGSSEPTASEQPTNQPQAQLTEKETQATELTYMTTSQLGFQQMLVDLTGPGRILDGLGTDYLQGRRVSQGLELPGLPECVALDIQENQITLDFGTGCQVEDQLLSGSLVVSQTQSSTEEVLTIQFNALTAGEHALNGTVRATTRIGQHTFAIENLTFDDQLLDGSVSIRRPSLTRVEVSASVSAMIDGKSLTGAFNWEQQLSNEGLTLSGNISVTHDDLGSASLALDALITTTCSGPKSGALVLDWQGEVYNVTFNCETLTFNGLEISVDAVWAMIQSKLPQEGEGNGPDAQNQHPDAAQ